jgi:glycosyltransferase involved in cell wall biosynthesis
MPSVFLINQFYYPDHSGTSLLLQQLAEDLVKRGFSVTVLAGNVGYEGGKSSPLFREVHEGVSIRRARTTRFGKRFFFGRLLDYISFHLSTFINLLLIPKHDIVLTLSTPPLIGWTGWVGKKVKRSRYVYWLQDLYPEVAAALGTLNENTGFYRLLKSISGGILKSADAVVVIGRDVAEKLKKSGVVGEKIEFIPNWTDESEIVPVPARENKFLQEHHLQDKFVVLYSGNFGRAHIFEDILQAAERLKDEDDYQFVFVGLGNRKQEILEAIERKKLSNIRMLPYVPYERLGELLSAASVGLVTQAPETAGLLVPSKVYGLMAAGRPIIYVGPSRSEVAQTMQEAGCGWAIEPGGIDALVACIRLLRNDPALGKKLGGAGRQYCVAHFSRSLSTEKFARLLNKMIGNERADINRASPVSTLDGDPSLINAGKKDVK